MNIALRKSMTLEQFLAWEERQELRYEFDGFQPVAMNGVRVEHAAIEMNLTLALGNRLRGRPCRAFGSNLKIEVAGRIRYPDAFVVCTPVPRGTYIIRDPVAIFEILSPSTSHTDLVLKTAEYPNIRRHPRSSATSSSNRPMPARRSSAVAVRTGSSKPPRTTTSCACRKSASKSRWPKSTPMWHWSRTKKPGPDSASKPSAPSGRDARSSRSETG